MGQERVWEILGNIWRDDWQMEPKSSAKRKFKPYVVSCLTMGFLLLLGLALVFIPPFLPQKWALRGHALFVLSAGLLWLDHHVTPFMEVNDRLGLGQALWTVWLGFGLIGISATSIRMFGAPRLTVRDGVYGSIPAVVLLAVLFFHWLSNRLAGADSPVLTHALAGGIPLAIVAVAFLLRRYRTTSELLTVVIVVACLSVAALTVKAAVEALHWQNYAESRAGGKPFCVLTYAGRDKPAKARSVLQLSPLVSRRGGRSFEDDLHQDEWIVIRGEPASALSIQRNSICPPVAGGNV